MDLPPIDPERIALLCRLARLRLPADGGAGVQQRLTAVLAAFASLRAVDTSSCQGEDGVDSPVAAAALRADAVGPVPTAEASLAHAARTAGGCFLVPRVVDG